MVLWKNTDGAKLNLPATAAIPETKSDRIAAVVAIVACGAVLLVLAWRGTYVRWLSDDYWVSSAVAKHGFWGGQAWWYRHWSGRWAFNFVTAVVESLGPQAARPLTFLGILAFAIPLARRVAWPVALAIAYAICVVPPDPQQTILWQTGVITYVLPVAVFGWWMLTTFDRDAMRWFDVAVPLVAGGFSETGVIAQVTICAVFTLASRRKPHIAGLIGSLVAFASIALAPGNFVRRSMYAATPPISRALLDTVLAVTSFLRGSLIVSGMTLVLVFATALLFAPRVSRRTAVVAAISALAVALATFGASEATLVTTLPARAQFVAWTCLIAAVAVIGAAMPQPKLRVPIAIAILVSAVAPIVAATDLAREIPDARTYAKRWDRFYDEVRLARGRDVVVAGMPSTIERLSVFSGLMSDAFGTRSIVRDAPGAIKPAGAVYIRFDR